MWPHVYVICVCLVFLSVGDLLVNCFVMCVLYILLFKNLAILYEGGCVLSITGLIGLISLCVFMYALILGVVGFMFSRYLRVFLFY